MANNTCLGSIKAVALRAGRLAASGAPSAGATNMYTSSSLIELGMAIQVDQGTERQVKNGSGDICQILREPDKIKGLDLTMQLCELDAELLEMLTGATIITSGGSTIGHMAPAVGGQANPNGVSLEAWSWGWDGAARAGDAIADPVFLHWVFPLTRFTLGTITLNEDFMNIPLTGKVEENPSIGTGPNNDLPAALAAGRLYSVYETATVPAGNCGYQVQPAHP